MKTIKWIALVLVAGFVIGTQSCKKDNDEGSGGTATVSEEQQASDDIAYMQESEEAMNDADNAMAYSSFGKNGYHIEGAVIDSVHSDKKIIITYNGNNGNGSRHREGKVTIQLTSGTRWSDQGAVITVTFDHYTVRRNNGTGKKIMLDGTITLTNMSGGSVFFIAPGDSVHHRMAGVISISFDNGNKQYNWTISRDRVIGRTAGGAYYISLSGFGTDNGDTHVSVKGTNRNGKSFVNMIDSPVVLSSSCGWDATSGHVIYKSGSSTLEITFGVDSQGNPQVSGCPYGFRLNWTNASGQAKVAVVKY